MNNPNQTKMRSSIVRAANSIRTKYSLATAFFVLFILSTFYIGGRVVLVHLVKDAEKQIQEIGLDIQQLAYKNASGIKGHSEEAVPSYEKLWQDSGHAPAISTLLGPAKRANVTLAMRITSDGKFREGVAMNSDNEIVKVTDDDLKPYIEYFPGWTENVSETNATTSVGIMRIAGRSNYIALTKFSTSYEKGFLILGATFDSGSFMTQVNETFSGMEIHIVNRKAEIQQRPVDIDQAKPHDKKMGIGPIFSEAISFYSGGFWELGPNQFEAVYAVRDIAGNAVSMISISLPRTFSSVTTVALGRLTVFIAFAGLLMTLPIFWFQSHVLLNPLSEMIRRIREIGEHHTDVDCPRLTWDSKDEFADLANSVNSMLETISRRSLVVAQIEARQKALISCLPDALLIFDFAKRLVSISKNFEGFPPIPGFNRGNVIDEKVYGAQGTAMFNNALANTFRTGETSSIRLTAGDEGGQPRFFEVRTSKMDDHFALVIVRDVTRETIEHKAMLAERARQANLQKQESLVALAAGIAHDVKNVLAVILNTAEITWMDTTDDNEKAAIETIRDAVKRGSDMARELMTFAGETKLKLAPTKPADIMREAQNLGKGIVQQNISLSIDVPEGLPSVNVDSNQIWKVFFNLAKNASEAMDGAPGHIRITAKPFTMTQASIATFAANSQLKPGNGVLFQISDTGHGIQPEVLRRIFDPFFSTKGVGRGLGLATVSAIIDAHRGGIKAESEIGQGTTFNIFLPEAKTCPEAETTTAAKPAGSTTVLVIDDDPAIQRTTSILLMALKHRSISATNRTEALAALRERSSEIGLVLLDANLGDNNTVQLLSTIRATAPTIPVVISSGSAREKIDKLFEEHPFDAFLEKPYTVAELQSIISSNLRKS